VAYNFEIGSNKIKLLIEYENVTQKVLFAALMSGRKYVIPQNGGCSRDSNLRTFIFRDKICYQNATPLQNSLWRRYTLR
jgi:hypothetical protein